MTRLLGAWRTSPFKYEIGYWSRRITDGHRLVYKVAGDELWIAQARYHH